MGWVDTLDSGVVDNGCISAFAFFFSFQMRMSVIIVSCWSASVLGCPLAQQSLFFVVPYHLYLATPSASLHCSLDKSIEVVIIYAALASG